MTPFQHRLSHIVAAGGVAGAVMGLLPILLSVLDALLFSWASPGASDTSHGSGITAMAGLAFPALLRVLYAMLIGGAIALLSAPLVRHLLAALELKHMSCVGCFMVVGTLGTAATLGAMWLLIGSLAQIESRDQIQGGSGLPGLMLWFAAGGPIAGYVYWRLVRNDPITKPEPQSGSTPAAPSRR